MNDIDELKQFVLIHARAQGIPQSRYRAVLDRIHTDDAGHTGSWTAEWCRAAAELEDEGNDLDAARCYNLARFPYVDGAARHHALNKCIDAFDRWRQTQPGIQRLDITLSEPPGRVACWANGLSTTTRRPLLLVTGGIVSIKEQWAPILTQADVFDMAMVVTELPGVGQNTLRYDQDSWRMLPGLLDALAGQADVDHTYALALSFSGHLALRCAVEDRRIRGIVTAGLPVRRFFTDRCWQQRLPRVTLDTLAHLTAAAGDQLLDRLPAWALTDDQLRGLDIPVHCTVSTRDEIIPPSDPATLRTHLRQVAINEYDDVHGSPNHVDEAAQWTVRSLLQMRNAAIDWSSS